jgi:hypothetical protein
MSDPVRLSERGDLGASLLRAARRESPPGAARRRATAAIGVAVATTLAPSSAAAVAAAATRVLIMKTLTTMGVAAVLGGVVGVALPFVTGERQARAPSKEGAVVRSSREEERVAPAPRVPPAATPSLAVAPAPPVVSSPPAVAPAPPPLPPAKGAQPALAEEVAALGRAQQSLEAGEPREALRRVDAFFVDFPAPHLKPEAEALRIEALAASGDGAGARSFLSAFRSAHPDSPLIEHLETVTRTPSNALR